MSGQEGQATVKNRSWWENLCHSLFFVAPDSCTQALEDVSRAPASLESSFISFFFFLIIDHLVPNKGTRRKSHNAVTKGQDFGSAGSVPPPVICGNKLINKLFSRRRSQALSLHPSHSKRGTFCRTRATLVSRKAGAACPNASAGTAAPVAGHTRAHRALPRITPAIRKPALSTF